MNTSSRSPDEHAGDWRFAALIPETAKRLTVHPDGMDTVSLVADEEGDWWAVPGACRKCGDSLAPTSGDVLHATREIRCLACGAAHGPAIAGCSMVATMVVDQEIYLLVEPASVDSGPRTGVSNT